jgi:3-deoxy-D-arabino-heptulosonate 7-phosphate (DAHP) synthase
LLLTPTDAGIVAANMDNVVLAAQSVATIVTVADNILDVNTIAAVEVLEDMNILANTQTLADIEAVAGIADLIEEGVGSIGNTTSQGMFQHNKRIVSDKTITEDYNAISAGPVTVDEGVTVTVPEGSTWTVV